MRTKLRRGGSAYVEKVEAKGQPRTQAALIACLLPDRRVVITAPGE